MKKIIYSFLLLIIVALPAVSFASTDSGGNKSDTGGNEVTATLSNPLNNVSSLQGLVFTLVNIVVDFSYVVIAFFLILSGFKFVSARGNESKLEDAKKTFYYTIIGAVLVIGAKIISDVISSAINSIK